MLLGLPCFFDADDDGDRSNDADAGDDQRFPMDLYPLDEIATFLHFITFTSSSRPSSRARWSYPDWRMPQTGQDCQALAWCILM